MIIQATVTGKNQITIPAAIVRALQLEPVMKLEFELGDERTLIVRPVLTRAERVKQIEEKWQPLFPPGRDPVGELVHEREQDDSVITGTKLSHGELARQIQGKWRHLLEPSEDPIGDLIQEREAENEAIDETFRPLQS